MLRILPFILLLASIRLPAQIDLTPPGGKLPVTAGSEKNITKLVGKLTEGKTGDKEKFDAIFTWVAQNIHYDYASYLAPRGTSMPRLEKILRSKGGVCLDYAYLMDTMCTLAGLQNVTVYGYVKDDLFDPEDSIYIDNHAWNAVKLENYWYVYDVTWSAGQYRLELKRFSKWLVKIKQRLLRPKTRTLVFRNRSGIDCDNQGRKFKVQVQTIPLRRWIIVRILNRIPLRSKRVWDGTMTTDFYLANPEVMAVTHMPDDPRWSLTAMYPGIRAFEVDPKYYHLEDTLYDRQIRTGRYCGDCDSWQGLDELQKEKQMKHTTWAFNPRNHFAASMCDYRMAGIFFSRAKPLSDSTEKVQQLDSALTYYSMAKDDLRKARRDVTIEIRMQMAKNSKKMKMLQDENKAYYSFFYALMATTHKSTGKMKKFISRTRVTELRLTNDRKKLDDLYVKTNPFNNKDNVLKMQDQYIKKTAIVDSLSELIAEKRLLYSDLLLTLSKNMYAKDSIRDSVIAPVIRTGFNRYFFLLDNYKKKIVEDRKRIPPMKELYANDLYTTIYQPSDSISMLGIEIFRAIEKRDQYVLEAGRLLNVLVNENMVDKDSLKRHIDYYDDVMKENICWLTTGSSQLQAVVKGYKRMLESQKNMKSIVQWESRLEYQRYRVINREINWRKRKFGSIPGNNMKVCSRGKSDVARYKRTYLKSLKEARKKEKAERRKTE